MSPYITPPSKCGVTTREDRQEVARSALVKGIESKMAALICRATLVFAVEQRYLRLCMDLCVNLPLIVTFIITLELE
jgi:hypothetical protein